MEDKLYWSLKRYYKTLSIVGYKPAKEVARLLSLLAIDELTEELSDYITKDDIRDIDRAIACLIGSCMIPNDADKYYMKG